MFAGTLGVHVLTEATVPEKKSTGSTTELKSAINALINTTKFYIYISL